MMLPVDRLTLRDLTENILPKAKELGRSDDLVAEVLSLDVRTVRRVRQGRFAHLPPDTKLSDLE